MPANQLFYGDNLDVLRRHIENESVDLVYLDPPFNSKQDYNILFGEQDGSRSAAQIKAFTDTWRWDEVAVRAYEDVVEEGGSLGEAMRAFQTLMPASNMLAYLSMMAPRLKELHRVLKRTGSIYLHCDPTASHYLKLLMDAIFGPENFRNEVIWKRHNARSTDQQWPRIHDIIFLYSRSKVFTFNQLQVPGDIAKMPHTLITGPDGEKYQTYELTGPGVTQEGDSGKPWHGFDPSSMGRHWANTTAVRDEWNNAGLIHWPKAGKQGGFPRRMAAEPFVPEERTVMAGDVWTDIDRINQSAKERLRYPTQKPQALLERIITASTNEGDTVLDPFCGCGTTIAAAHGLGRPWIGIDITHLAITLIRHRLLGTFGKKVVKTYTVTGEPTSLPGAKELAAQKDRYPFQYWALGLVGARPSVTDQKKGSDKGIDGKILFHDEPLGGKTKQVILSVKSGHVGIRDMRELSDVVADAGASLGVLITLEEATQPMRAKAAAGGVYKSPWRVKPFQRLQILTIADLLAGKEIDMPPPSQTNVTFRKAPKAKGEKVSQQPEMFDEPDEPDPDKPGRRTRNRMSFGDLGADESEATGDDNAE